MVLTVATILDIVHIVASFFAQKTHGLSTSDVELLLAACLVALHARANGRFATLALFLANIANLSTQRQKSRSSTPRYHQIDPKLPWCISQREYGAARLAP